MAKDSKFGTFGGVFTPSILTILGVIMYLRLPTVVGQAGLYGALGIILIAHVISWCTGLSISSIATDKRVGAGGPYYIVSRSLGLPIGGTLGLALFIGLSFSISLYVIGFSESMLSYLEIESTPTAIRITGTLTIFAVTIVTLISTAFAIKTQYLILTLIALSLVSILMGGSTSPPDEPYLRPLDPKVNYAVLFGIFFPAVTGFTAGVNMSGDLRDPKQAIPRGTILAIATGMAVYVSLTIFIAYRIARPDAVDDTDIFTKIARFPWMVTAGVWGATLSSALGGILGAPRILQALSRDAITPRIFAKGYGKAGEPRNALALAFIIGEAGILIAELDAIARIVSMVFLTTYGFLNFSCAIESWASPDFRPTFRVWKAVPIIGALAAVFVMIELDLAAMAGATLLMAGTWFYLQRRQLTLDSGDAWEGIWSSLIRSGLYRLSKESRQRRNWRPNILLVQEDVTLSKPVHDLGAALISGSGILTEVTLQDVQSGRLKNETVHEEGTQLGIFYRSQPYTDFHETVESLCRYHGFATLRPNTLLMRWSFHTRDPNRFGALLDALSELDYNVLLYKHADAQQAGGRRRIDVWWRPGAGNLTLSIALLRFITGSSEWLAADIRFLLLSQDVSQNDYLRSTTRRLLAEARLDAQVRVLNTTLEARTFEDRVRDESALADLTLLGVPRGAGEVSAQEQADLDTLTSQLGRVLLLRESSAFTEDLDLGRQPSISFLPPSTTEGEQLELPDIDTPDNPQLAKAVDGLASAYQSLSGSYYEQCLKRVYGEHMSLIRSVRRALDKHYGPIEKALSGANPRRQRNVVNRAESTFLYECQELFDEFERKTLADLRHVLDGSLEAIVDDASVVDRGRRPEPLRVIRPIQEFRSEPEDSAYLGRFKWRRRTTAALTRRAPSYPVPVSPLKTFYFQNALKGLFTESVKRLAVDTHQTIIHLGKVLNVSKADSLSMRLESAEAESLAGLLRAQEQQWSSGLEELVTRHKEHLSQQQWAILVGSRELVQGFARDVDRLDVARLVKTARRPLKKIEGVRSELLDLPSQWVEHQKQLIERGKLGLVVSSFQHRLAGIAGRTKESISIAIKGGVSGDCVALLGELKKYYEELETVRRDESQSLPQMTIRAAAFKNRVDTRQILEDLIRDANESCAELPDVVQTLSDESIQHLEEGSGEAVETVDLSVRRLVQFLIESEFIGGLQQKLSRIPQIEQRAATVAQDVVRLVTFHTSELGTDEEVDTKAYAGQMAPLVKNGIERLQNEIGLLNALDPELKAVVDERLVAVLESSNPYELTSTSASLEQHVRLHQGRRAVSDARSYLQRGAARAKKAMVDLIYRRSAGVVLARKLTADAAGRTKAADRMLSVVNANSPKPEVLEALPFYYRQLFFGQSTVGEAFWVGRSEQLAQAKTAIANVRRGTRGALIITGERGSGKTGLCQRILDDLLDKHTVHRVYPPAGGSTEPHAFAEALRRSTGLTGGFDDVFKALPQKSVIFLDDLELWWERGPQGMKTVDVVLDLINRYADRALFMLALNRQAFELINRLRPLSEQALAVLDCSPLPADQLKQVVTLRHGSTGLKFALNGIDEDDLSEWRLARLFSKHFDYSKGYIGATLRAWVTHITRVSGQTIAVHAPDPEEWDVVDELKVDQTALLLQLILHKQATETRLQRITGLDHNTLEGELKTLVRMGLVVEGRQQVLEINPFLHHIVLDRFSRRGLLA